VYVHCIGGLYCVYTWLSLLLFYSGLDMSLLLFYNGLDVYLIKIILSHSRPTAWSEDRKHSIFGVLISFFVLGDSQGSCSRP